MHVFSSPPATADLSQSNAETRSTASRSPHDFEKARILFLRRRFRLTPELATVIAETAFAHVGSRA